MRCRASPLISFLAPAVSQRWWLSTAYYPTNESLKPLKRHCSKNTCSKFHTTAYLSADSSLPNGISSKASDVDLLDDRETKLSKSRSISRNKTKTDTRVDILLANALDGIPNPEKAPSEPQSSSALLEDAYNSFNTSQRRDPRARRQQGDVAGRMEFPPAAAPSKFFQSPAESLLETTKAPSRAKRQIRSRPSVGRTVDINPDRGMDFGKALRNLEIQCAVNKVRQDLARQRFHERPGMKRKRLKSERWRKLFRESFRATVGRVKEMRRKGW